jgi:peptidoglycan/LPS O-acetylase OafA/YrhL
MQEPVRTAAMQSAVSPPLPAGRIPELDGLRGTAILLVFISHYLGGGGHLQLRPWLRHLFAATNIGWSGVDLFFILSGFLIGGILIDARNSPHYFRAFYMRRVHRILPIYYLWILLYAIIVSIALLGGPNPFSASSRDLLQIPVQFLFLQNLEFTLYPFQHIWFLVTWSLAVEEQFYIFAPPLIRFLSLRKLIYVLGCAIVVAPIFRFVVFRYWFPNTFAPAYLLPCRADALALGVLLAIAWRNSAFRTVLDRQRRSLQLTLLFLFLGACASLPWMVGDMSLLRATVGYSWLAALYACLLLLVLSQTQGWLAAVMRWKPLRSLGAVSYCVYLIHLTILFLAHDLILHSSPQFHNFQGVAVTLLAAAITLAFAALSWRYFEKPLIRRGHTYAYGEKSV